MGRLSWSRGSIEGSVGCAHLAWAMSGELRFEGPKTTRQLFSEAVEKSQGSVTQEVRVTGVVARASDFSSWGGGPLCI